MEWAAKQPQFTAQAQAEFATVAGEWLVAYAMDKGGTVATHEVLNHNIKKRIKIPNFANP